MDSSHYLDVSEPESASAALSPQPEKHSSSHQQQHQHNDEAESESASLNSSISHSDREEEKHDDEDDEDEIIDSIMTSTMDDADSSIVNRHHVRNRSNALQITRTGPPSTSPSRTAPSITNAGSRSPSSSSVSASTVSTSHSPLTPAVAQLQQHTLPPQQQSAHAQNIAPPIPPQSPSKRVKLKQLASNMKEKWADKWAGMKLFGKKSKMNEQDHHDHGASPPIATAAPSAYMRSALPVASAAHTSQPSSASNSAAAFGVNRSAPGSFIAEPSFLAPPFSANASPQTLSPQSLSPETRPRHSYINDPNSPQPGATIDYGHAASAAAAASILNTGVPPPLAISRATSVDNGIVILPPAAISPIPPAIPPRPSSVSFPTSPHSTSQQPQPPQTQPQQQPSSSQPQLQAPALVLDAKQQKQALKEFERQYKLRQEAEKQAKKEQEKQVKSAAKYAAALAKDAQKREHQLLKERAKAAEQARREVEKKDAELKKEIERHNDLARREAIVAQKERDAKARELALKSLSDKIDDHDDASGGANNRYIKEHMSGTVSGAGAASKSIELLTIADHRRESNTTYPIAAPIDLPSSSSSSAPVDQSPVSPAVPSARLGIVRLHLAQGRNINGRIQDIIAASSSSSNTIDRNKQKTCLEVIYGGVTYKSGEWEQGSNPRYEWNVMFPIYDITTDIVIQVILKHSLKKNECIGMIVIPLAVLLNRQKLWEKEESLQQQQFMMQQQMQIPISSPSSAIPSALSSPMAASRESLTFSPSASSSSVPSATSSAVAASAPPSESKTLRSYASSLINSLFAKRDFHFNEWLQIYPYGYDKAGTLWLHRFPAAEDTILASGMERPKKELGQILCGIHLQMEQPLSFGYMQVNPFQYFADFQQQQAMIGANGTAAGVNGANQQLVPGASTSTLPSTTALAPPVATPSHPIFVRPEEPLEFHKTVMKKNVKRIRRWLTLPHWFIIFDTIFSWKIPNLTFYFLALWIYICFEMPPYQYPLFLVITCLLLNIYIKCSGLKELEYSMIHTYQDDALPSNYLGEGSWKKFQRYKGVLGKMSYTVGKIAATLEKTSNMLNFTDLSLSIFVYSILIIFAILLTVLLYIIPAHICVFLGGLSFFVRGAYDTFMEWIKVKYPAWFAPAAASSSSLVPPVKNSNGNAPPIPPRPPASGSVKDDANKKPSFMKTFIGESKRWAKLFALFLKALFQCLKYLYRRSPDYYEVAHRVLCERAIATNQVYQAQGGLPGGQKITPTTQARKILFGTQAQAQPAVNGHMRQPTASSTLVRRPSDAANEAPAPVPSPSLARQTPSPMKSPLTSPHSARSIEHLMSASAMGIPRRPSIIRTTSEGNMIEPDSDESDDEEDEVSTPIKPLPRSSSTLLNRMKHALTVHHSHD